jgi:hypothetical protein
VAGERGAEVVVLRDNDLRRPPVALRFADLPEQLLLPLDLRRARADLAHALSIYRAPVRAGVPLVVTFHDVVPSSGPTGTCARGSCIGCSTRRPGERGGSCAHRGRRRPMSSRSRGCRGSGSTSSTRASTSGSHPAPATPDYLLFVGGRADDDPRKDLAGLIDAFAVERVAATLRPAGTAILLEPISLRDTLRSPRRPLARFEAASSDFNWWVPNLSALKAMCWSAGLVGVRVRGLHRPRGELGGVYAGLEAMSMRTTSSSRSS